MCEVEISGDAEVDAIFDRMDRGESVNLEEMLRGEKWEPVKKEGGA